MTATTPINPKATVAGSFNPDMDWDNPIPAGEFEFYQDSSGPEAGMVFGCPCGCGEMHSLSFRSDQRPSWQWDGNREAPTLSPSLNILQFDAAGNQTGEHWHGWLQAGVFRSC